MYVPEIRVPAMKFEVPDFARITSAAVLRYARSGTTMRPNLSVPNPSSRIPYTPIPVVARTNLFISKYGIKDEKLAAVFAAADADKSGDLSWAELATFQGVLYKHFSYKSNATALSPDEFVRQGGGDCEDWALVTAAFCDYWGWGAYVACFFGGSADGHALCMVKSPERVPGGFTYWHVTSSQTLEGDAMPSGDYVPVDYDQVGTLSNAVKVGETLKYFMTPTKIYGVQM